jgi:hypothetical protein
MIAFIYEEWLKLSPDKMQMKLESLRETSDVELPMESTTQILEESHQCSSRISTSSGLMSVSGVATFS